MRSVTNLPGNRSCWVSSQSVTLHISLASYCSCQLASRGNLKVKQRSIQHLRLISCKSTPVKCCQLKGHFGTVSNTDRLIVMREPAAATGVWTSLTEPNSCAIYWIQVFNILGQFIPGAATPSSLLKWSWADLLQRLCFTCFGCAAMETAGCRKSIVIVGLKEVPSRRSELADTEPQCQRSAALRRNSSDPIESKSS